MQNMFVFILCFKRDIDKHCVVVKRFLTLSTSIRHVNTIRRDSIGLRLF
jgi:hypothetical protein